ncbi:preprotein translocase subunit Sec61beta [Candidatus Bathyarchaeota archaeon]|nr:MAG: preprotein translocase subunit Sec61beta [Candidatus Bathyarchaeota archaeon]
MSRRRREEEAIAPASSAGLLRFFQDESYGFKVRPELVVISAILLIVACIVAHWFFKGPI